MALRGLLGKEDLPLGEMIVRRRSGLQGSLERLEVRRVLDAAGACSAVDSISLVSDSLEAEGEEPVHRHLVMVTHGWNSNVDGWPKQMQTGIVGQLRTLSGAQVDEVMSLDWSETQETLPLATPTPGTDELWEVATLDWRGSADTSLPTSAATNAAAIGARLASQIIQRSYETIHLIAHSAGSGLIDMIVASVEQTTPTVVTQLTFLDSFTPGTEYQTFGTTADWAEHFVDKGLLPFTNEDFAQAINIDLSIWGPSSNQDALSFGVKGHSWPWEYYLQTIRDPMTSLRWGFTHSLSFGYAPPLASLDGSVFILGRSGDANDDGLFDSSDLVVMFQFGKFESNNTATRIEGDWDGNQRFDTSDLVKVFQAGLYQG